jgi:8-oxo-dGTP pyrophosphatase MutT (NUDIX family)
MPAPVPPSTTVHEHSAGLVLFRRSPARLYLLLDYGKHWDYPKGHVEAGESDLNAARRELKEETGIDQVTIFPGFARQIEYYFRDKKKGLVHKSVVFFLAETDAEKVTLSDEHVDFAFLPVDEAVKRLTFASARQVLRQAEEFVAAAAQTSDNPPPP